jgi:hypothetical protein
VKVTFILNVLHKDMSILAADQMAIADFSHQALPDLTAHPSSTFAIHDFKKITLNSSSNLALGIAGFTHEHSYTQSLERSDSIDDGLLIIRKHMGRFMRIHDRIGLLALNTFTVNQGIASFFDQKADVYFTNTFLFSPIENQTRLHRGTDVAKVFHAGSGSEYFKTEGAIADIESFVASTKNSCTSEACISWMQETYKRVGNVDAGTGAEAVFVMSTRSKPKFHFIERL